MCPTGRHTPSPRLSCDTLPLSPRRQPFRPPAAIRRELCTHLRMEESVNACYTQNDFGDLPCATEVCKIPAKHTLSIGVTTRRVTTVLTCCA